MRATVSIAAGLLVASCGGTPASPSSSPLFASPAAQRGAALAPDLHARARLAWQAADAASGDRSSNEEEDRRTEARLWLAAAIAEADRIELDRRRLEVQAEEERWAKQLARDQRAAADVARDISRFEARAVALAEAERLSVPPDAASDQRVVGAMITRARLNLALAQALGAAEDDLRVLDQEADAIERRAPRSAERAHALLLETDALIGGMRARWPEPLPGAATDLVQTALATGFTADRNASGVIVRSGRFFTPSGNISSATVQRFSGLLAAFPHGPVACQTAVPATAERAWSRRVAALVERFGRLEHADRVSTGMVVTEALGAGTVQCTFAAYRGP